MTVSFRFVTELLGINSWIILPVEKRKVIGRQKRLLYHCNIFYYIWSHTLHLIESDFPQILTGYHQGLTPF